MLFSDFFDPQSSLPSVSQSQASTHTEREQKGGRTRSRAAIIADVAFISLWRFA